MKRICLIIILTTLSFQLWAAYLLIPMDETQKNHLKAYGIAYWSLQHEVEVSWLLKIGRASCRERV